MAAPPSPDIIDCVFTSLPDFATLLSTILVSKSFHDVFQAHPSSILTSVAKTQIGPELLPCAIRLAHFDRNEYLASRASYVQGFPSERNFTQNEAPEVTTHLAALAKNDSVVVELELFFSTTRRNRKSGAQSLLNSRESLRFRRALYRWWLMINLFPAYYLRPTQTAAARSDEGSNVGGENEGADAGDNADDDNGNDDDDTDDNTSGYHDAEAPNVYIEKSQDMRKVFLSEFSDDEVAEMWQVHSFMVFTSGCTWNAAQSPVVSDKILLWSGPCATAKILRALRSFGEPQMPPMEQIVWHYTHADDNWPGLSVYLQEKNYDASKVGVIDWDQVGDKDLILGDTAEASEECDECLAPGLGCQLWDSSNWHLLPCAVTFRGIIENLPGKLNWNALVLQPLVGSHWVCTSFINHHVSPGTPDWSEGKLLCMQCVLKLMGRRVLNSLRELRTQHGPQLEDCWYGYNCRTQRTYSHAVKLNHLCDPTRGD